MIIKQTCGCGTEIRENGEDKFAESAELHFKKAHRKEWEYINRVRDEAQQKFEDLVKDYPELRFNFSWFWIDYKKLLKEV